MPKDADSYVLEWPGSSDGSSAKWPGPPYVKTDNSPIISGWLQKLGQSIATVSKRENPEKYRMKDWPAGYAVFTLPRPGTSRSDHYLYGGPKKYRSAAEAEEHAIWLYFSGDPPIGYRAVLSSPSKRQASSAKGSPTKSAKASATPSKSSTSSKSQPPVPHQPLPSSEHPPPPSSERPLPPSSVRALTPDASPRKSGPSKKVTFLESITSAKGPSTPTPPPTSPPTPANAHEVSVSASTEPGTSSQRKPMKSHRQWPVSLLTIAPKGNSGYKAYPTREQINRSNRTYRIGELVWCVIEPNLFDEATSISIDQWPGLIEAYRVKKMVLSADAVSEEEIYHVKLLALNDAFIVPGSRITPYKGYKPVLALISLIQSLPPPAGLKIPERLHHFHEKVPYLLAHYQEEEMDTPDDPFLQATGAYALALQNAARLSLIWGFAYPQILESESETWYHKANMKFAGLWWGPELIYVGEMVILVSSRAQLAQHPTTAEYVHYTAGDENRAVILQIKRLETRSPPTGEAGQGRAFVVGVLYELVPLLSDTPSDPVSTLPKQTAPLGMMWKQLLPLNLEVCVDIILLSGRYYEDVGALPSESQMRNVAFILQGLSQGVYGHGNTPTSYYNTRAQMCRAAKTDAFQDLEQYWLGKLEVA